MKPTNSDHGRIAKQDHKPSKLMGTGVVFLMENRDIKVESADYRIRLDSETHPEQFRAARLNQDHPSKLPEQVLGRSVLVLMGAEASPEYAVEALEALVFAIRRGGLPIGYPSPQDDQWYTEFVRGNKRRRPR